MQCLCCVVDVSILSIHNNANCTIKLEEERFQGKSQFVKEKCVHVTISVNPEVIPYYRTNGISFIAFFEYNSNECYGTRGTMHPRK